MEAALHADGRMEALSSNERNPLKHNVHINTMTSLELNATGINIKDGRQW